MPGDIQRLFSMINQADLPYRVFEDRAVSSDASSPSDQASARREPPAVERRVPANEDIETAHAGLFRAYNVEAALSAPAGRSLDAIFHRMSHR